MQKRTGKRIVLTAVAVMGTGIVVLAFHIWWVMRPRVDAKTRVMARIDLHQPIRAVDANRITAWLYRQKGVEHVFVNPQNEIALFTYSPLQNNANTITQNFCRQLDYPHAVRIVPSGKEMAMGCSVAGASLAYKVYQFVNHIF